LSRQHDEQNVHDDRYKIWPVRNGAHIVAVFFLRKFERLTGVKYIADDKPDRHGREYAPVKQGV